MNADREKEHLAEKQNVEMNSVKSDLDVGQFSA
jgi:hypothetical protein